MTLRLPSLRSRCLASLTLSRFARLPVSKPSEVSALGYSLPVCPRFAHAVSLRSAPGLRPSPRLPLLIPFRIHLIVSVWRVHRIHGGFFDPAHSASKVRLRHPPDPQPPPSSPPSCPSKLHAKMEASAKNGSPRSFGNHSRCSGYKKGAPKGPVRTHLKRRNKTCCPTLSARLVLICGQN